MLTIQKLPILLSQLLNAEDLIDIVQKSSRLDSTTF